MKCNKVKNSCKICFQSVTKKNGLQCQGACQKWAHFKCLNYTPGKIQDIKAGVIKVTCPCPDCNTKEPKEILADPPFTCTNTKCPANKLPFCGADECPSNFENPLPTCPPPRLECSSVSSVQDCCPKKPPTCPPPRSPCHAPRSPCSPPKSPCSPPRSPCPPPRPPCPPPRPPPCIKKCPSPPPPCAPSPPCIERNCPPPCPPVCPPNCPSWQKVKKTNPCSPQQSQSCSDLSNESSYSEKLPDKIRTCSSDSRVPNAGIDQNMLFSAIENLCNTVGQLSNQLRDLMCKMKAGYGY